MENVQRMKAVVAYDGTFFSGYQVQPNKRTVQQELEHALAKIHKSKEWHVVASGRTDAGVHSYGQTIHFDTHIGMDLERWKKALNSLLPDDIYVKEVEAVAPTFHARYDTVGKKYVYQLNTAKEKNVFQRNYLYELPYTISYDRMVEGANYLIGTHDFTSFSSPRTSVVDKVRTIYVIEILREVDDWTFIYVGNGFLYQMVRILTGTLLEIGKGKMSPIIIKEILEGKDRSLAGPTVPGKGLYLASVYYEEEKLHNTLKAIKKFKKTTKPGVTFY